MKAYKIAQLLIVMAIAFPVLLQGMEDAAERAKLSGYISAKRGKNSEVLNSFYKHGELLADMSAREWHRVAEGIVAGCNIDPLFGQGGVTAENILTVCVTCNTILMDSNANQKDRDRITVFLNRCIETEKVKKKDLPDSLKQLINDDGASTEPKNKSTLSKISIYKMITVFAVGALAVIVYKWLSKKQAEAKKAGNDETDAQPAHDEQEELTEEHVG